MLIPSSVAKVLQRAKGRRCVLRCQVVDYADLYLLTSLSMNSSKPCFRFTLAQKIAP